MFDCTQQGRICDRIARARRLIAQAPKMASDIGAQSIKIDIAGVKNRYGFIVLGERQQKMLECNPVAPAITRIIEGALQRYRQIMGFLYSAKLLRERHGHCWLPVGVGLAVSQYCDDGFLSPFRASPWQSGSDGSAMLELAMIIALFMAELGPIVQVAKLATGSSRSQAGGLAPLAR